MYRPNIKHSQRQKLNQQPIKDWKESRLVVAVLSAAGTATLFSTVIMPLVNSIQSNKIEKLEEITRNSQATLKELEETKSQLAKSRAETAIAIQKNVLASGSVYPIGLDSIVIGTPVSEIKIRLPEVNKEEDESYYTYRNKNHPIFSGATYYSTNQKVVGILYHFKDSAVGAEIMKKAMLTQYGEPYAEKKGNMLWKSKSKEWVNMSHSKSRYTYYIQDAPYENEWGDAFKKNK